MDMNTCGTRGVKSEINITPYIDILLVLLIIFMVVTPARKWKLPVRAPQLPSRMQTAPLSQNVVVVSIGESAEIAINRIPVGIGMLGARLQEIFAARSNKDMFISASPSLPYGDIVKVIEISRSAGVGDIGLLNANRQ